MRGERVPSAVAPSPTGVLGWFAVSSMHAVDPPWTTARSQAAGYRYS